MTQQPLISLSEYQTLMGVSSSVNDAVITNLITVASRQIEQLCDRKFWNDDYYEFMTCYSDNVVFPRVNPVKQVYWFSTPDLYVQATDQNGATLTVSEDRVTYYSTATNTTSAYALSSFATTNALFSAISVDNASFSYKLGTKINTTTPSTLLVHNGYAMQAGIETDVYGAIIAGINFYLVDDKIHLAGGWHRQHARYWVRYNAGYNKIPQDLQQVCALITKDLLDVVLLKFDPKLKSQSITNYSYTVNAIELYHIVKRYEGMLSHYNNVVMV